MTATTATNGATAPRTVSSQLTVTRSACHPPASPPARPDGGDLERPGGGRLARLPLARGGVPRRHVAARGRDDRRGPGDRRRDARRPHGELGGVDELPADRGVLRGGDPLAGGRRAGPPEAV